MLSAVIFRICSLLLPLCAASMLAVLLRLPNQYHQRYKSLTLFKIHYKYKGYDSYLGTTFSLSRVLVGGLSCRRTVACEVRMRAKQIRKVRWYTVIVS